MKNFLTNFLVELREEVLKKMTSVILAIMKARSLRISEIARELKRMRKLKEWGGYDVVLRLLDKMSVSETIGFMRRLFDQESEFVIGDVVEIEMKWVGDTHYAGILKDGETKGVQLLCFGTLYQGRVLIFSVIPVSSKILQKKGIGKFEFYVEVIRELRELIGERLVVYDRELSNEMTFEALDRMGVKFLIRR